MYKKSIFNTLVEIKKKNHIYNSFTKGFLEINSPNDMEEFVKLINSNTELESEELQIKDMLLSNGFIVADNFNELDALEYIYRKRYFDSSNLNLILVPSLACNFNCPYCFEKGHENFKYNEKYVKILKSYSDENFRGLNNVHISLFGGEPLLYQKALFSYLEYLYELKEKMNYNLDTSIVTNGSLITEEVIENLIKYNCRYLQITLDGDEISHNQTRAFKDGRNSFDILIKNIQMIADKTMNLDEFKLTVRFNLNNIGPDRIEKALSHIEFKYRKKINLLFRAVFNTKTYEESNDNKNSDLEKFYDIGSSMGYKILKSEQHYASCEACGDENTFYVMPDLTVWKCINDLSYKKACIGKIDENGQLILDSQNIINWHNASSWYKEEKCTKCTLLPDCLGGCILHKSKTGKSTCKDFQMNALTHNYID